MEENWISVTQVKEDELGVYQLSDGEVEEHRSIFGRRPQTTVFQGIEDRDHQKKMGFSEGPN